MTRTHITTKPGRAFGAGILEEGRAVQRRADDVPNPQRRVPNGQPPAGPAGEAHPEVPAPEPSKGPIEFRVQAVADGWPIEAVFKVHPSKLKNALRNLARYGIAPRPAKGGGS